MKKAVLISFGVIVLLILGQVNIFACTCVVIGNPTVEQRLNSTLEISKIAFSGTVIEVRQNSNNYGFTTKFKVKESWKGSPGEEVTLTGDGSTCEDRFTVDEDYLVFAYIWKNLLTTGICTGNLSLSNAADELKILGEGEKPKKSEPVR